MVNDEVTAIHFSLVKNGFGTYREVCEMDARTVLQIINFESFRNDYELAFLELNKDGS